VYGVAPPLGCRPIRVRVSCVSIVREGNKIDTKIYVEKSSPIWRSKQPRVNRSTINRGVQVTERAYIYRRTRKNIPRHNPRHILNI
jgi:hypothetical protein